MSDELITVDEAARRLRLHPKTVLRFIHEGRLAATKIGKAYRIHRADLEALAGAPAPSVLRPEERPHAQVTAVVDLAEVGPELARIYAQNVSNALNGKPPGGPPIRAEVIYEPERRHVKMIIVGGALEVSSLLGLIEAWRTQLGWRTPID